MKSITALTAVSAMPVGVAFATQSSAAGVATVARANLYTWSAMIARTKGACSPELLMRTLNVGPARANFLFSRLVSNNVVHITGTTIANQTRSMLNTNPSQKTLTQVPKTHTDDEEPEITDSDVAHRHDEDWGYVCTKLQKDEEG